MAARSRRTSALIKGELLRTSEAVQSAGELHAAVGSERRQVEFLHHLQQNTTTESAESEL